MGGGTPTDLGSCGGLRWLALGVAELRRRPKSLMRLSAACWEAKGDGIGLSEIVRAPMGSHGRERRHDSREEEDLGLPCRGCGRSVGGMERARGRDVRGAWWVRMGAGGGLPRLCAPELCCRVGCGYGEKDLLGLGLDRD